MLAALVLLAAVCTPLTTFTPTPTLKWDASAASDIGGHFLYRCPDSGPCVPIATLPCEWSVSEDDGVPFRFCRGADLDIAVQKYGDFPANTTQTFRVAPYDVSGNVQPVLSSSVTICMSPVCTAPGPCQ